MHVLQMVRFLHEVFQMVWVICSMHRKHWTLYRMVSFARLFFGAAHVIITPNAIRLVLGLGLPVVLEYTKTEI